MPIGTRDILLTIRAKDQASRIIQGVGQQFGVLEGEAQASATRMLQSGVALAGLGIGMMATGALVVSQLNNMRLAAVEYNKTAALTLTQVGQIGVSVKTIADIGLAVAKAIPAPLKELQPALYDIFSSIDVNVTDAQKILEGFAKASVAGSVDVRTAGRETLAFMNAFGLGIGDLGHIQDIQFQLVRKGVGTYDEFASSIGRAIPSATRAGQSMESLAGVMAFLTRNGISADLAATSAARAFDGLSKPKIIKHFNDLGIALSDSSGNFRSMADIATDLGKKLDGLTATQKAKALNDLFTGAGNNVQAMRFWSEAINHFDQLNSLTADMVNSSGALQGAYDIMFNQPASQAQLLANNLDALKIELGQQLIPIFNDFVKKMMVVVHWFANLSDHTKHMIVTVAEFTAAFLLIGGAVFFVTGSVKALIGLFQLFGGLGQLLTNAPLLIFLTLLALAAIYVYQHWDKFKPYWEALWSWIKEKAQAFTDWFLPLWKKYWPEVVIIAKQLWADLKQWFETGWAWVKVKTQAFLNWFLPLWKKYWPEAVAGFKQAIEDIKKAAVWFWTTFGPAIVKTLDFVKDHWKLFVAILIVNSGPLILVITAIVLAFKHWDEIRAIITAVWMSLQAFGSWFWGIFGPGIMKVFTALKENVGPIINDIWQLMQIFWDALTIGFIKSKDIVDGTWLPLWTSVKAAWDAVVPYIMIALHGLWDAFSSVFDNIVGVVKGDWDILTSIWAGGIEILRGILDFLVGIFSGDWGKAWDGIKEIARGQWDMIKGIISGAWEVIKNVVLGAWDILRELFQTGGRFIVQAVKDAFAILKLIFFDFPANVVSWLGDLGKTLWNKGIELITGFTQGIINKIGELTTWIIGLPQQILGWLGDLTSLLFQAGKDIMNGLKNGILDAAGGVFDAVKSIPSKIVGFIKNPLGIGSPSKVMYQLGSYTMQGFQLGLKDGFGGLNAMMRNQGASLPTTVGAGLVGTTSHSSTTSYGMYIANATFHDHVDVEAAQKVVAASLTRTGVM